MHLLKSRLVLPAVFCASALFVPVSHARASSEAQDPRPQLSKTVAALNAFDAPAPVEAAAPEGANAEKPEAPAPKFAIDAGVAQQSSSAPGGNPSQQKDTGPPSNPTGTQDDNPKRILGLIPNFETKNDDPAHQKPLTVKEKYILELHQTVDFSSHIGNIIQAAMEQAANVQPHYGQGWGPYAERFGAAEADQATSAFFMFGFLPSVLHDDPRYFRRAEGSILSRTYYAATRTVITRKDSGDPTFNIPAVAGLLFQQSISTAYYPPEDRSAGRVFENWGTSLAFTSVYNVLKEFYPDLLHLAFHRHHTDPSSLLPSSH